MGYSHTYTFQYFYKDKNRTGLQRNEYEKKSSDMVMNLSASSNMEEIKKKEKVCPE